MAPPKRQRRSQALDNLGSPPDGYLLTGDPDADEGMAWSNDVTTALAAKAPLVSEINSQADDYTLVLSDSGKIVELSKGSAVSVTVPPNASVAFPVGTRVDIVQVGAGQVTVAAGAGVTVRTSTTLLLTAQWAVASLYKRASNEWVLAGDLEAA